MPSLGDLFGLNDGRRVRDAEAQAQARIAQARAEAEAQYRQSAAQAQGYYDGAAPGLRADLNQGYDDANRTLTDSLGRAQDYYRTAYGGAEDAITRSTADANAALDPYYQAGLANNAAYQTQLSGGQGAADAYGAYAAPTREFTMFADEYADKQRTAAENARGVTGGRALMAQGRASELRQETRLNEFRDRLERAAGRGAQVAGQVSANTMQGGQNVASIRSGLGDRQASAEMGTGQAIAGNQANRGSALSQVGLGLADRSANLAMGTGNNLANLSYGSGQQSAALGINRANAINQSNAGLRNNLIQLGGLAIGGMTGGLGTALGALGSRAISGAMGGSDLGSLSGLGASAATGNWGNIGQSQVGPSGLPALGRMF